MYDAYKDSELIIGLVAPLGVNINSVENIIRNYIKQFKYDLHTIKLSDIIKKLPYKRNKVVEDTAYNRIYTLMEAGNELRKNTKNYILTMYAILDIYRKRTNDQPLKKTAHLIRQFKHPEEVLVLRRVYTHGFFLLGISSSYNNRLQYLNEELGIDEDDAKFLMEKDEEETFLYGQHTRDTFYLADGFIDIDADDDKDQFFRIFDLLFGNPHITPSPDEHAMFLAFASSFRSGDLSRQVGAVISSSEGDIIATGTNDVPKYGGGLYSTDDPVLVRDIEKGEDSNKIRKKEIVKKIMLKTKGLNENNITEEEKRKLVDEGEKLLKDTGVLEITEYGRTVHAEMEALLTCARIGVSARGGILYCTTFPCHNCAKHIVATGITKVIFVEPYPKSKALDLHDDSIFYAHDIKKGEDSNKILKKEYHTKEDQNKVIFQPFVGIGYRRYSDLFSMKLSTGLEIKRENDGIKIKWDRNKASLRVTLLPMSYIELESTVLKDWTEFIKGLDK